MRFPSSSLGVGSIFRGDGHHAKSKKGRPSLTVTGKTEGGSFVVRGIFEAMSSTTGLPLEIILEELDKRGMTVDWVGFYESSLRHGWKWKTTRERVRYSVREIYGDDYCWEVMSRLIFYRSQRKQD